MIKLKENEALYFPVSFLKSRRKINNTILKTALINGTRINNTVFHNGTGYKIRDKERAKHIDKW